MPSAHLHDVVLWEAGAVTCRRLTTLTPEHIVITLTANGICFERQVFTDPDAAAAYAIDKMRAYSVR